MPQSRVLTSTDSLHATATCPVATTAKARQAAHLRRRRQALTPVFTALAVTVMVVVSISFARSVGLVAPLWGAAGLAVVVWLRTSSGRMYDYSFGAMIAVGLAAGNFLVGNDTVHTIMFTVANMLDIVVAVLMARRFAPTLNLQTVDPRCGTLDYITGSGRELQVEHVMSNNFAFGGINTSLIFRKIFYIFFINFPSSFMYNEIFVYNTR